MLILKSSIPQEMMVKNSRFLSEVIAVSTPDEAREVWHAQKIKYDNGGHIVYAFITGPQGTIAGCSDDGEPSGTAGGPMLNILKKNNLFLRFSYRKSVRRRLSNNYFSRRSYYTTKFLFCKL